MVTRGSSKKCSVKIWSSLVKTFGVILRAEFAHLNTHKHISQEHFPLQKEVQVHLANYFQTQLYL